MITTVQSDHLRQIATHMGVTPAMALEMAVNRMFLSLFPLIEGDLEDVDFSQSLPECEPGPDVEVLELVWLDDVMTSYRYGATP